MNLICGINPVVEALTAGSRHFDRLLVVKGIRNQRVSEAIAQVRDTSPMTYATEPYPRAAKQRRGYVMTAGRDQDSG